MLLERYIKNMNDKINKKLHLILNILAIGYLTFCFINTIININTNNVNTKNNGIVVLYRQNDPAGYLLSEKLLDKNTNSVYIYTYFYKIISYDDCVQKELDRIEVLKLLPDDTNEFLIKKEE